jgi:tetratricopeptide (TPR) repeat protein
VKPNELLAAAREAFWLHKYEDAEKNYRALTELEPQNPDGYGELGNMYFSQGRWEEAAAAYYEAGVRLVREGRLEPARELVNVIRGLNGKQADDLEKLISSASGSADHR